MKEVDEKLLEVLDFRFQLSEESDRGCALMAASFLDEELKLLLRMRLVDDKAIVRELFAPSGPLGSFSSRIDLAYLLGMLGAKSRRDLHLIRKIRNEFGHCARSISFEEDKIASRCADLHHDVFNKKLSCRGKFTRVVCGVLAVIHGQVALSKPIPMKEDIIFDDDTMEEIEKLMPEVREKLDFHLEHMKKS